MSKMLNVKDLITVGICSDTDSFNFYFWNVGLYPNTDDCIAGHCSVNCRNSIYAVFNKS